LEVLVGKTRMKGATTVGSMQRLDRTPRSGRGLLAAVPLFQGLSNRELRKVAGLASEVWLNAGKLVVEEGEAANSFYVIVDGSAKVIRRGSERALKRLGPGDHFGELALLDSGPRTVSVIAETTLDVIRIDRPGFRRLLLSEPAVGLKIMEQLVSWIRECERRLFV
jgi:CRP-like cAMP-binding protein